MPLLSKPAILPVKGIDLSVPNSYLPEGNNYPLNLKLFKGELYKREGKSRLGGISIGGHEILHLDTFETSNLEVFLFRMTRYNLERYNTSLKIWQDFTGINDLTGTNSQFFSSVVAPADDLFMFTNFADYPKKIDDSGGNMQNLTTSFKAKFIEYLSPYVLFAYLEESGTLAPHKVRWSDANDPTLYTGGTSGSQLLTDEPSAIRGMKKLQSNVYVYKEKSVYRGTRVSSAATFDFGTGPFEVGKGALSGRAIVDTGEFHVYMGLNDFHMNDGVRISDIGDGVREYLFNRINRSAFETMHAIHVPVYKEVWFFVTTTGNTWPTEVWKYRYDLRWWYQDTVENVICATTYKVVDTLTWDDIIPSFDSQSWAWDDRSGQANSPEPTFGYDTGYVHINDLTKKNDFVTAYNGRLETKDFGALDRNGNLMEDTRWMQVDVFARGNRLDAWYSTDEGSTWNFIDTKTLDEFTRKYTYWFDVVSTRVRFRFENAESDSTFALRSFQPYFLARENNFYG